MHTEHFTVQCILLSTEHFNELIKLPGSGFEIQILVGLNVSKPKFKPRLRCRFLKVSHRHTRFISLI